MGGNLDRRLRPLPLHVRERPRGRRRRGWILARKAATVGYLSDGVGAHAELLERLGPHTTGVSCVYLKDLATIDLDVLEEIVGRSYATLTKYTTELAKAGGDG